MKSTAVCLAIAFPVLALAGDEVPTPSKTAKPETEVPGAVRQYFAAWKAAIKETTAALRDADKSLPPLIEHAVKTNAARLAAVRKARIAKVKGAIVENSRPEISLPGTIPGMYGGDSSTDIVGGLASFDKGTTFFNAAAKTKAIRFCTEDGKKLAVLVDLAKKKNWAEFLVAVASLHWQDYERGPEKMPGTEHFAEAPSLKDAAENIIRLSEYRKSLDASYTRLLPGEMKVGMFGVCDQIRGVKVLQVLDKTNMIAVPILPDNLPSFWISKYSTEGLVDGGVAKIPTTLVVTGTKTYTTVAGGSRTLFVLEPFDLAPWLPRKDEFLK